MRRQNQPSRRFAKSVLGGWALIWLGGGSCTLVSDYSIEQCEKDQDCHVEDATRICEARRCVDGCADNAQCSSALGRGICPSRGAACAPLLSANDECFIDYGYDAELMDGLRGEDLAIVGAFAPKVPPSSPARLTFEFATREINKDGGLPGRQRARPLLLVVCSDDRADIDAALAHLVDELGVRAVLASLEHASLRAAFERPETHQQTLFLSPFSAYATAESSEYLWYLSGSYRDAVPAYAPLLTRLAERLVRAGRARAELRLAWLTSEDPADGDLEVAVRAALRGVDIGVDLAGRSFRLADASPDERATTLEALIDYQPDLVLFFAGRAFGEPANLARESALIAIEGAWADAVRPLYVLSPRNAGDRTLEAYAASEPGFASRAFGVELYRKTDPELWSEVSGLYAATFPNLDQALPGNVYDAVYYLAYAVAAAGINTGAVSAESVLDGFRQVSRWDAERVDVGVGSDGIGRAFERLRAGTPFALYGTSGAPDFDASTRTRPALAGIYCIDPDLQNESTARVVVDAPSAALSVTPAGAPSTCLELLDGTRD